MFEKLDERMNMNSNGLYDKILEGWERSETASGVPYYINHNLEKTQWDHPMFVKTVEELVDMDSIRYAAYRTSMKLRFLQKRFHLDMIDLRTINAVFNRRGYRREDDTVIDGTSLFTILVDLCSTNRIQNVGKVEAVAEMLLNWLLNLYDPNRTGCLRVMAVKIGLATLSSARLSEKYRFFFNHLNDSTNHITTKKLATFLRDIMQIPELINEAAPFGGLNIAPAVQSCFKAAWKPDGITEDEFLRWLLKEPQTVVWLPTMHRLSAAETVKHEAKCSICKAYPIIGFRYRCLKCFNYDMCQICFFTGRLNKKHKLKHPTQEYCVTTTTKEDTKDFMKTVRNNLSKKHRNKKKLRYLPVDGADQPYSLTDIPDSSPENRHPRYTPRKSPRDEEDEEDEDERDEEGDTESLEEERQAPYKQNQRQMSARVPHHSLAMSDPNYSNVIKSLEFENRQLMQELAQLQVAAAYTPQPITYQPQPLYQIPRSQSTNSQTGSDASEVEWLREEREKLEAKQEVLESHNKQLELQLYRLRLMLKEDHEQPPAQNGGNFSPYSPPPISPKHPPPPYHPTPTRPSHPLSQSLLSTHHPHQSPHSRHFNPANESPGLDMSYADPALGQTHYSLPSPNQSRYFPDEEAELEELMEKLDRAYPSDMTHSLIDQSPNALDEMYSAVNRIGDAFSGLVSNLHEKDFRQPDGEEDSFSIEKHFDDEQDQNTTLTLHNSCADSSYDTQ